MLVPPSWFIVKPVGNVHPASPRDHMPLGNRLAVFDALNRASSFVLVDATAVLALVATVAPLVAVACAAVARLVAAVAVDCAAPV